MTNTGRNFELFNVILIDASEAWADENFRESQSYESLGTFPDVESALAQANECELQRIEIRPLVPARPHINDVLSLLEDNPDIWSDTIPDEDVLIEYSQEEEAELREKLDEAVNRVLDEFLGHRAIGPCNFAGPARAFSFDRTKWIEEPPKEQP